VEFASLIALDSEWQSGSKLGEQALAQGLGRPGGAPLVRAATVQRNTKGSAEITKTS
jgi:hypothetical protein